MSRRVLAGTACAVGLALLAATTPAAAQQEQQTSSQPSSAATPSESHLAVSAGTEWIMTNAYVWRGFVPNSSFSVQPNIWVKVGDFTASSWSNVAKTHVPGHALTEHDFTLDYSKTRGSYTLSAGWINYMFPELSDGRHSDEVYLGLAHNSYFAPSFRVYQDVHEGTGTYVNIGVSHTYPVYENGMTLTPSVSLGYNHQQWIDASTFSDLAIGARLTLPAIAKHLTLAPFVTHSHSLDRDLFDNKTYGGVSIALR